MRTYYRGPDIAITDQHFAVLRPVPIRLHIADLHNLYVVGHSRGVMAIRATYLDRDIELFRSTDVRIFGQVRRALIRAVEATLIQQVAGSRRPHSSTGSIATATGGSWLPPEDWPEPPAVPLQREPPFEQVDDRRAEGEPRWRVLLERLLLLPLTRSGAMVVAIDDFDRRMSLLLSEFGDPTDLDTSGKAEQ